MARRVKDKKLDSREARSKLKVQGKPYYRAIERGMHLGYRRLKGVAGSWCARFYLGDGVYEVEAIGIADDLSDADGGGILNFWQAQEKARKRLAERATVVAAVAGSCTVGEAMDAYIAHLERERPPETIVDVRQRDRTVIRPTLGAYKIADLTAEMLRKWLDGLAAAPTRRRQVDARARRATANRNLATLRAAFNLAFLHNKVDTDKAWKHVKPFASTNKPRDRYLSIAECKRLINGCDPDFRELAQGALLCGARYGQLARLTVVNFNPDGGTLSLLSRKGKGAVERQYHVHLTAEGVDYFKALCAGRAGANDLIFTKADGTAWGHGQQCVPMIRACDRAHIEPAIGFHGLRHTWASHAVMNGVPLLVVAQNLGHTDTRMVEKVYGHLAPSYRQDEIRKGAPTFGIKPDIAVL